MKIRIKDNSIRFRLTQSEVIQLNKQQQIVAHTYFGNQVRFSYGLYANDSANQMNAQFKNNCIRILIPQSDLQKWATSEIVSLQTIQEINEDEAINLLIEKDFKCLQARPNENEEDNFPNPLAK